MNDIKVVQDYITYLLENDLEYRYPLCESCDSEFCMLPGLDDSGIYLFCLGYKCQFRRYLGLDSIKEMSDFLASQGIKT